MTILQNMLHVTLPPIISNSLQVCTHSFNLDESDVENQRRVWRYCSANPSISIPQVRREGYPPPFPQTGSNKTSVHAWNDSSMAKSNNVGRVVIKTVEDTTYKDTMHEDTTYEDTTYEDTMYEDTMYEDTMYGPLKGS
jgi:hypothetical protein